MLQTAWQSLVDWRCDYKRVVVSGSVRLAHHGRLRVLFPTIASVIVQDSTRRTEHVLEHLCDFSKHVQNIGRQCIHLLKADRSSAKLLSVYIYGLEPPSQNVVRT